MRFALTAFESFRRSRTKKRARFSPVSISCKLHYMKMRREAEERGEVLRRLREIPNIGPAMADDLMRIGIRRVEDLAGRDPDALYEKLCRHDGARHDICVLDAFAAAVWFANGNEARPWWFFSRERLAKQKKPPAKRRPTRERR
jgi:hypothetical protein